MKYQKYFLIALLVILVDQITKYLVKMNMYLGQEVTLWSNHLKLRFEENNGFAFGMEFTQLFQQINIHISPESGKLMLSLFSIIAVIGLGVLLYRFSDHRSPMPAFLAIIFGGAIGNIIDRTFYGVIFSPINLYEGGLFHGRVVDMIFVDLGPYNTMAPIFNIADTAISFGIVVILLFQSRFIRMHEQSILNG